MRANSVQWGGLCEMVKRSLTDALLSFVLVHVVELDVAPSTSDESF